MPHRRRRRCSIDLAGHRRDRGQAGPGGRAGPADHGGKRAIARYARHDPDHGDACPGLAAGRLAASNHRRIAEDHRPRAERDACQHHGDDGGTQRQRGGSAATQGDCGKGHDIRQTARRRTRPGWRPGNRGRLFPPYRRDIRGIARRHIGVVGIAPGGRGGGATGGPRQFARGADPLLLDRRRFRHRHADPAAGGRGGDRQAGPRADPGDDPTRRRRHGSRGGRAGSLRRARRHGPRGVGVQGTHDPRWPARCGTSGGA